MKHKVYNIIIIVILFPCAFFLLLYNAPEAYVGGNEVYHDLILPISISYIMAFVFYLLTVLLPQKNLQKEKREILQTVYNSLIKRLCEILCEFDKEFKIMLVLDEQKIISGWNYHSALFEAFTLNNNGLKAIKTIKQCLQLSAFTKIYCNVHKKDEQYFNFSDELIPFLEDNYLQDIFVEIKVILLPQIISHEDDIILKKSIIKLYSNIADTKEIIAGQKECNTGGVSEHFIRFINHFENIYETLLKNDYVFGDSYKT